MIPQVEPHFGNRESTALAEYIRNGGWGTEHLKSRELERVIAEFLGVKHCSLCCNGTQSLLFSLMAVGVTAGDEVLVPSLTMVATANAVRMLGATPIFCDVNDSLCLDWNLAASEKLSPKTKAVIHVSLNGRSEGLAELIKDCYERGIMVIEDACQSFGSMHKNFYLGTLGDIGCFSMSPHKIISTGQGGFMVTNSDSLHERFRKIKDFGRLHGGEDVHPDFGMNGKFTDFQAVVGLEQMKRLKDRIASKKRIYALYEELLSGAVEFIPTKNEVTPWFVDIYVGNPERLKKYLEKKGIQTRRMYPPVHSQPCYNEGWVLPNTERYSDRGLWLPSSFTLEAEKVQFICRTIRKF